MSSNPPESETSAQSRSWAAPLVVAAVVLALMLGLYLANSDESAVGDPENEATQTQEPTQAQAQAQTQAQATEAAPPSSDEPSDPIKARALRVARMNPVKVDENSEQFLKRLELIELVTDRSDEAQVRRREVILWFMKNHPDDAVLQMYGELYPELDGAAWTEAITIFEGLVAQDDVPPGVLANYASWSTGREKSKAIELYGRLQDREPDNPKWLSKEAHLYMLDVRRSKLGDPDAMGVATLAKEALATALEYSEGAARAGLLANGIEAAALAGDPDTAEAWARELLESAGSNPNAGHVRHTAHQGLGLAALVRGDTDGAVAELLQMGDVPPGSVQKSFGPSMRLANELLARGEREAVIQYLQKVATFWKPEGVEAWIERLRAGENFRLN
jgi:hypothetical protein